MTESVESNARLRRPSVSGTPENGVRVRRQSTKIAYRLCKNWKVVDFTDYIFKNIDEVSWNET